MGSFHGQITGFDLHPPSLENVENNTGSDLSQLKVVKWDSVYGTNFPRITPITSLSDQARGVVYGEIIISGTMASLSPGIPNTKEGKIISFGLMENVNTSSWTIGTKLYSDTNGDLSTTPSDIIIGEVLVQDASSGVIYINLVGKPGPPGTSPLATKGDLFGYDTGDARLPVGADDEILVADSVEALGLAYKALKNILPLTTKGDILVFNGSDLIRLPVGADDEVLTVDSLESSGLKWGESPSNYDPRDILIFDHFLSSNLDIDEIGKHGWKFSKTGVGNNISLSTESGGHPGVILLESGTAVSGYCSLYLGEGAFVNIYVVGSTNAIEYEVLVKFTGSISISDVTSIQMGLGDNTSTAAGYYDDFIGIRYDPGTSQFRLVCRNTGTETVQNGTTTVLLNTWYRVGFVVSDPGGTPSVQMKINGINEGSAITTNLPTSALSPVFKHDSAGGAQAGIKVDYALIKQVTDKED